MEGEISCIANAIFYSVVLNIVLPMVVAPFATEDEIKPPTGAKDLSFKSQIMHMLVHHKQVPLTSSLVVALIVGLSVYLGYKFKLF